MMMMTTADKHGVLKYRKRPCRCYCFCGYQFAYQKKSNIKKRRRALKIYVRDFLVFLLWVFNSISYRRQKWKEIRFNSAGSTVYYKFATRPMNSLQSMAGFILMLDSRLAKKCQEKPDFLPTGSNLYQHPYNMSSIQRDFSVYKKSLKEIKISFWIQSF